MANGQYTNFQLDRACAMAAELLDALADLLDQAKATSAFDDALEGEDAAMLDAVNSAEKVLAMVNGEPHVPHTVGEER